MIDIVREIDKGGGVTELEFSLDKDEMSVLIFTGMAQDTYDDSLLFEYTEDVTPQMLPMEDFKQACADNGVSHKDGYLYIQVGIQTALRRGVSDLLEKSNAPHSCDSCEDVEL